MAVKSGSGVAVVGSGPNGLAAAVTMARAGLPVTLFEAAETVGGGLRTITQGSGATETHTEVQQDACAAVHPLALVSPFMRQFGIAEKVSFAVPEISYAHALTGEHAVLAYRDIQRTAAELGVDSAAYQDFYRPLVKGVEGITDLLLGGSVLRLPADKKAAATFGMRVLEQGTKLWNIRLKTDAARSLFTGVAAHTIAPLPNLSSAGVGTFLGTLAHTTGWPVPIGGSGAIASALLSDFLSHGGRVVTSHEVRDVRELDGFKTIFFNTSAMQMLRIAGERFNTRYRRALKRFRFGDGIAKVDFVLDGPVPWTDERLRDVATVHVGGRRVEMVQAEKEVREGLHPESPYVLVVQSGVLDVTRNAQGVVALWTYTHVPHGSDVDVTENVIRRIETFAPNFRDRILHVESITADEYSRYNLNYEQGDFNAGAVTFKQMIARPVFAREPWRTPANGIYLASQSTAPGPGVHGMAGWLAARSALKNDYGYVSDDM